VKRARRLSPQTIAVLLSFAEEPSRWRHGYDLCRSLGLKAGTVYPILIRLAERGYVETEWEQDVASDRPPRHLYRLSSHGAELVSQLRRRDLDARGVSFDSPSPHLGGAN
jgi:PadR family transcriptional regulator, regulatory protein PadR